MVTAGIACIGPGFGSQHQKRKRGTVKEGGEEKKTGEGEGKE